MSEGKHANRMRTVLILPLLALVAAVMLLAWGQSSPRDAEAGVNAGMNLTAPATVFVNTNFVVTVTGNPLPPAYSGYSTEVVFPAGLKWQQRADCGDEIGVTLQNGNPPASCIRATGPGGEARHVVISGIVPPPQPVLIGAPLLSIDVRCNTVGMHKLVLTAVTQSEGGSSFGASYFAPDTSPISVTTITQNIDGDPADENIADGQVVNCTTPPTNTPTRTPTNTVPPTDTPTPCPPGEVPAIGGGCAAPTSTPPATPTPTPLPTDTQVVLSGPTDAPPGGAVDVTANVADAAGTPLEGVTCVFTIVDAPEGSDASLESDSAVTDANGDATVTLNVGSVSGTINVQADCGGIDSQVLAVNVTEGVTGPPTGDSDSAASTAIWVMLATAVAAGLAGLGFIGWRRASQAR